MANTKRSRSYRGSNKHTSGSGALIDTVRNTITGIAGTRGRRGRAGTRAGRTGTRGGSNLVSQASGFVSGLLSGGGGRGGRTRRSR